jgi:chemotaxis signal transduction protein
MSKLSFLSAHRASNRQVEIKQQLVIFWLHQAWFALPITAMSRSIPIVEEVPVITEAGLELPVVDLKSRIFPNQSTPPLLSLIFNATNVSSRRSLLIVKSSHLQSAVIIADSQPILQRISESVPLVKNLEVKLNTELIESMILAKDNCPEIFVLNPDLIVELAQTKLVS